MEHLLRDVKDATVSTLSTDVSGKLQALNGLKDRLQEIQQYMGHVLSGKLPINHDLMTYLQVRGGVGLQNIQECMGHAGAICTTWGGGVRPAR